MTTAHVIAVHEEYKDIIVTEVSLLDTMLKLFIQFVPEEIRALEEELTAKGRTSHPLSFYDLSPGRVVLAKLESKVYRVKILNKLRVPEPKAYVEFIDYGFKKHVKLQDLRELADQRLRSTASQVNECVSTEIVFKGMDLHWITRTVNASKKLLIKSQNVSCLVVGKTNGYPLVRVSLDQKPLTYILLTGGYGPHGNGCFNWMEGPPAKEPHSRAIMSGRARRPRGPTDDITGFLKNDPERHNSYPGVSKSHVAFIGNILRSGNAKPTLTSSKSCDTRVIDKPRKYQRLTLEAKKEYNVFVSHVSVDFFYVTLSNREAERQKTEAIIQRMMDDGLLAPLQLVKPGVPCMAVFGTTGLFRRALIMEVLDLGHSTTVFFVDVGYRERKRASDLKSIPEQLLEIPAEVIQCSPNLCELFSVRTSLESCARGTEEIVCRVVQKTGHRHVVSLHCWKGNTLQPMNPTESEVSYYSQGESWRSSYCSKLVDNRSPSDHILQDKESKPTTKTVHPVRPWMKSTSPNSSPPTSASPNASINSTPCYSYHYLLKKQEIRIFVTHGVNPDEFYGQLTDGRDDLDKLMEELKSFYENQEDNRSNIDLKNGEPCCCLMDDGFWYRAAIRMIRAKTSPNALVRLVDYGNVEMVPVESLTVLEPRFLKLPIQAVRFSFLNNLLAHAMEWSYEEHVSFQETVAFKQFAVGVVERREENNYVVERIPDKVVGEVKEPLLHAKNSVANNNYARKPISSSTVDTLATDSNDAKYMYSLNSTNDANYLLSRTNDTKVLLSSPNNTTGLFNSTNICKDLLTDQNNIVAIYTAKVINDNKDLIVFTDDDEDLINLTTDDIDSLATPANKNCEVLHNADKNLVAKSSDYKELLARTINEPSCEARCTFIEEIEIPLDIKYPIEITSFRSPVSFYCRIKIEVFAGMLKELQNVYSSGDIMNNPTKGQYCVARSYATKEWQRVRVTKVDGDSIVAFFIDTGNTERISGFYVKNIREQYTILPRQAIQCSLVGVSCEELGEINTSRLHAIYGDNVRCRFLGKSACGYLVEVENGATVVEALVSGGFAVFD